MKVPLPRAEGAETKPVDPKAPQIEQPELTQLMRHGRGISRPTYMAQHHKSPGWQLQPVFESMHPITVAAGQYNDGQYMYVGDWENDKMHGKGKYTYASGSAYDGSWELGVYHGQGTYSWQDGRRYEVSWGKLSHPST